jgi:glycosyltransferase involved in cell wall biosynthesis
VGFISIVDPDNPEMLSGMPNSMRAALASRGCAIETFVPAGNQMPKGRSLRRSLGRLLPRSVRTILRRALDRSPRLPSGDEQVYRQTLDQSVRWSREIRHRLSGRKLDLLFGCCVSSLLYEMDVPLPIVYYSDTTTRLIFDTYTEMSSRGEGGRRAYEELESRALKRATAAVFATNLARRSAIQDYGVDPGRAYTVPMGANIGVSDGERSEDPEPPTRQSLRLVLTASDPRRKRTDFAVEVVDELRRMGWNAELDLIGVPTPRAKSSRHVRCHGFLSLRDPKDRKRHHETLRRCHLMILPSLGEAFGIAPCEAAHLGRPSVVSAAGGLPEVIQHGRTGIVLGLEADPGDYARAIAGLADDPSTYHSMAKAAVTRARADFTWDRWSESVVEIMKKVRKEP